MKKTTFSIVCFFVMQLSLLAQCPGTPPVGYTCIPDANFEQALIDFGYDTEGTLDGQMLTIDAVSRPTLSIINRSVLDFTGVEAFASITSLDVSYNPGIVTLDTSSNTLLESLNTEGCTALANLDLTNNTALTSINLFNNDLSALDLSNNLSLETINIKQNQLTSLDFSNHTALTSVDVKNNMLTFLDMRNGFNSNITFFDSDFNPNLICLFVDDSSAPYLTTLPWIISFATTFVNNEAECNTLSTENIDRVSFHLYPNPASDLIYISSSASDASLELYDINGKQVITKSILLGNNTLDISKLNAGIYIAKLLTKNSVETTKLIVD
ncbi:T9SS type A sorting domain-containing protein [Lacinutrix iliipiscaria]|uniref:T9SS type A sorting domain-containing protein n=1 Tax=Lacinutrix iliipiscaria TaxID=1230532 RepID=A0ABW5WKM9_9FLAO